MFDLFIYQEMRNIRRQHHISKEVILHWSAFVNVQDSHPYVAIGKISAETRRFFVALVMPLSVQILFRPTIADLAIAIRLRSSVEQPLLVVISDPRTVAYPGGCIACACTPGGPRGAPKRRGEKERSKERERKKGKKRGAKEGEKGRERKYAKEKEKWEEIQRKKDIKRKTHG